MSETKQKSRAELLAEIAELKQLLDKTPGLEVFNPTNFEEEVAIFGRRLSANTNVKIPAYFMKVRTVGPNKGEGFFLGSVDDWTICIEGDIYNTLVLVPKKFK